MLLAEGFLRTKFISKEIHLALKVLISLPGLRDTTENGTNQIRITNMKRTAQEIGLKQTLWSLIFPHYQQCILRLSIVMVAILNRLSTI